MQDDVQQLLHLNQRLLESIDRRDWDQYAELCDATLTAFEPEAGGHLISGLAFHRFYFEDRGADQPRIERQSSMSSPAVRLLGDVAVVTYVRLVQTFVDGHFSTSAAEETRVWERQEGIWRHVHFHRSKPGELE